MRRALLAGLLLLAVPEAVPAWAQAPAMVPMMGRRLFTPQGDELGRLVDMVCDATGRPIAAVVDVGGFMGLGSRRIALAWSLLRFTPRGDRVRLVVALPAEVVTAAPEYRPDEPATIYSPQAQ